jgi:hypothetical protein
VLLLVSTSRPDFHACYKDSAYLKRPRCLDAIASEREPAGYNQRPALASWQLGTSHTHVCLRTCNLHCKLDREHTRCSRAYEEFASCSPHPSSYYQNRGAPRRPQLPPRRALDLRTMGMRNSLWRVSLSLRKNFLCEFL